MKKNKKGFTLVELLAVIVVLAIIMIIAIPQVMESMNAAKKNSFKIYAQKVLNTASAKYQTELLTGTPSTCYKVSTLMGNGKGKYVGYVNQSNGTLTLYLDDTAGYYVKGATYTSIESDYNATTNTGGIQQGKLTGNDAITEPTSNCS